MIERNFDVIICELDRSLEEIRNNIDRWLEDAKNTESIIDKIDIMNKVVRTTKTYNKLENKRRSLYYKKLKRNQKLLERKFKKKYKHA